jgi:hypothetical protein
VDVTKNWDVTNPKSRTQKPLGDVFSKNDGEVIFQIIPLVSKKPFVCWIIMENPPWKCSMMKP